MARQAELAESYSKSAGNAAGAMKDLKVAKKKVDQMDYIKLYQEVFGTDQGKMVLMDLCSRARVFK